MSRCISIRKTTNIANNDSHWPQGSIIVPEAKKMKKLVDLGIGLMVSGALLISSGLIAMGINQDVYYGIFSFIFIGIGFISFVAGVIVSSINAHKNLHTIEK